MSETSKGRFAGEFSETRIKNLQMGLQMAGLEAHREDIEKMLLIDKSIEEKGGEFCIDDLNEINEYICEKYHTEEPEEEEEEEVEVTSSGL